MIRTCKFCGEWCCYDKKRQIEWIIPHGRRKKEYFHVDCFYKWFKKEDAKDEDSN